MSNKINIRQESSEYHLTPRGERAVNAYERTKEFAKAGVRNTSVLVGGVATGLVLGIVGSQLEGDTEFKGSHPVEADKLGEKNGTLTEIVANNVDGVEGNLGETRQYVVDLPVNAPVLKDKDGTVVHEGDVVYVPDSVERK